MPHDDDDRFRAPSDNVVDFPNADEVIEKLANLPEIEYDQQRKAEAQRLGVRREILDRAVKAKRGDDEEAPFVLPEAMSPNVRFRGLSRHPMSAFRGRCNFSPVMSGFGGKADVRGTVPKSPLLATSGHSGGQIMVFRWTEITGRDALWLGNLAPLTLTTLPIRRAIVTFVSPLSANQTTALWGCPSAGRRRTPHSGAGAKRSNRGTARGPRCDPASR